MGTIFSIDVTCYKVLVTSFLCGPICSSLRGLGLFGSFIGEIPGGVRILKKGVVGIVCS